MLKLKNKEYFIGKIKAIDIIKKFGTPLYTYDLQKVREQAQKLRDSITWPNKKFLYAVKIQYNPQIVEAIKTEGYGIDAVSLEEIKYALRLGFDPKDILYTGNNITDQEMQECHKLGVMLNIGALSRLEKYGQEFPGSEVFVRINPQVEAITHEHWITAGPLSKFGTSYAQIPEILETAKKYDLKIVGIHEHIGTSIMHSHQLLQAIDVLLQEAHKFPNLKYINFGGGIGLPYKPDEKEIDINEFGQKCSEKFSKFCEKYGREITLMMEPGRYIVGDSGTLIAEVNTLKTTPEGRTFAGVNTGYHHLIRPMTYGSYHPITNISNPNGELKKYDVAGNICESGDLFARDRMIQEISEYDFIGIQIAGSSGFAMANNYHLRPLPPEIVIDGEKIIESRKRQKLEELLAPYGL